MSSNRKKILVAAIDIGTTYSVCAFSFKHDYDKDPTKVYTSSFWPGRVSFKIATCVLCDPNRKFHSFGHEAEHKYAELIEDNAHHKWYFFRRFKTVLYEKQIEKGIKIEDDKGQKMRATTVFGMAIRYLKENLIQTLERLLSGKVEDEEIHWTLTVPAIWTGSAKDFMRDAAMMAGIDVKSLTIALEPEAAVMYCQLLPSGHLSSKKRFDDKKYIVIDLGGETVDIAVHEKQEDGNLNAVYTVSSGACRGAQVDEEFKQMIIKIIGARAFMKFCEGNMADHLDMWNECEIKNKASVNKDNNSRITIKMPVALAETYEKENRETLNDAIEQSPYRGKILWLKDRMRLDTELLRSLFQNYIRKITEYLLDLFDKPVVRGFSTLLMVGEFSECQLIQVAIKRAFPSLKVIIPHEAEFAVLKGAVILGHKLAIACDYNFPWQPYTNDDYSPMTTMFANINEDDVSSDDITNQSTCSSSYEQSIRKDQIGNLKNESLSEEGEEFLSSDYLQMSMQIQDKGTPAMETQLEIQMTLKAANINEDDVSSDDITNQSACSSSYEQSIRKDQIGNLKNKSLSEEGEEFVSSDYLQMSMQRQDKGTPAMETQLENQMTLKADIRKTPSDDELFVLSRQLEKHIKEWWLLAKLLGLSDKQIAGIENGGRDTVRQYYEMLTAWKNHNAGQEKGSVGYLLRQCDEAGINREMTDTAFGN